MAEATHQDNKLNVFISYSRDDLGFSDQLEAALGVTGFDPTLDRHGISGGEDWKSRLGNLIRDADTVVFVLSPSSARSEICAWEVGEAVRLGKRIIPVLSRSLNGATPPASACRAKLHLLLRGAEIARLGLRHGARAAGGGAQHRPGLAARAHALPAARERVG